MKDRFTRISFKNYKALKRFSVNLNEFNVLVGPNNSGKSTIVGAFRILAEGMRKARSRKAQNIPSIRAMGYQVPLEDIPVATENIFTNYEEAEPAVVEFKLSSGNKLKLIFPENNSCYLTCEPKGKPVLTPSAFNNTYTASIGFVPVLGPVEHNEPFYKKEAARRALLTHGASRNFRNIWYHYPEDFDQFRELIKSTWPSMDIEKPELDYPHNPHDPPILHMFCPEERYLREIFWAGFGFQVWCQILTYIVRAKDDDLLIIDEPDIYLHSDLQRQLVEILRQIPADILIATHSTEIISEVDPGDLLVVNKKGKNAERIKDTTQLQSIFGMLGSNLNPTLTQLAKSRRAIFVEGKDFQVLSALSRKIGFQSLANRSDFAVIPVEGFNPSRVLNLSEGIELTLGTKVLKAVIFDRDYRSKEEIQNLLVDFKKYAILAHIHQRKEIENYLLGASVIQRAIESRVSERATRSGKKDQFTGNAEDLLRELSDDMKSKVTSQFMSKREKYLKSANPSLDQATINERMLEDFEKIWSNMNTRLEIVPGKSLLALLNKHLQDKHSVSLTPSLIVNTMKKEEIPTEIIKLLEKLESFRTREASIND